MGAGPLLKVINQSLQFNGVSSLHPLGYLQHSCTHTQKGREEGRRRKRGRVRDGGKVRGRKEKEKRQRKEEEEGREPIGLGHAEESLKLIPG